jgi:hypothetical protein
MTSPDFGAGKTSVFLGKKINYALPKVGLIKPCDRILKRYEQPKLEYFNHTLVPLWEI